MAKKVRKDGERKEEKKALFDAPEFDEREYLEEQLGNIKVSLVFILYAIPFGLVGAYIGYATGSGLGGLGFAIVGYMLGIFLFKFFLEMDLLNAPKRQILTSIALFLMSYLAFAVLLSNPPVHDASDPSITDMMVYIDKNDTEENWEVLMVHKRWLPFNESNTERIKKNKRQTYFLYDESFTAEWGDNLSVLVRVADSGGMKGVWMEWWYDTPTGVPIPMERVSESRWDELDTEMPYDIWGEHYWEVQFTPARTGNVTGQTANIYLMITAEDVNGHQTIFEITRIEDTILVS
jgi:hypothetical protein